MQSSRQRILTGLAFFLTTLAVATLGYMASGWSFIDSIYMVVITIFGVGFGEVKPVNTPALRIFTILVIICGTTSAIYIVGGLFQMLAEGEINKAIAVRRMNQEIDSLENHIIICGFGRMGQILARKLRRAKQLFILIDSNPECVSQAQAEGYLIWEGNATDESILERVGIGRAKILATVLSEDALNVFITLTARELNPNLVIIARGELPSTEKKLKLAGANEVVLPATIGTERMAHMITHPAALDFLGEDESRRDINELLAQIELRLEELVINGNSPFVNQPISQMEARGQGAFIVVAIRQPDSNVVVHPSHEWLLQEGDTIILLGHQGDLPQFARRYAMKRQIRYRGASF